MTPLANAAQKAEQLWEKFKYLNVMYQGPLLRRATISLECYRVIYPPLLRPFDESPFLPIIIDRMVFLRYP